jgi:hypothetical protein
MYPSCSIRLYWESSLNRRTDEKLCLFVTYICNCNLCVLVWAIQLNLSQYRLSILLLVTERVRRVPLAFHYCENIINSPLIEFWWHCECAIISENIKRMWWWFESCYDFTTRNTTQSAIDILFLSSVNMLCMCSTMVIW